MQGSELTDYLLLAVSGEELDGLVDGHFEYVIDISVVELHFEGVGLEAFAVAGFTFQYEVGHELHLNGDGTFAFALFAASSFAVEGEVSGGVAHLFGEGLFGP